jgi:hypothetical protein
MFLPSNEHTFQFSATGEKTKQKYEGAFKVKCLLNMSESIEAALRFDSYTRGSKTLLGDSSTYARAIAELELRVIDSPSWFKDSNFGRDLFDKNVVLELALQAMDAEKVFDDRLAEAAKKAEEEVEKQAKKKAEKKA